MTLLPSVTTRCGKGTWQELTISGHPGDLYLPPRHGVHGAVLIYLHGVHLQRLCDKPAFVDEFDRFGIPVIAPFTARSWWTDRICSEFDTQVSAQRYVLDHILPYIQSRFGVTSPGVGIFGTSMGGQGALRLAYKFPNVFPVSAAISPAIGRYR